MSAAIESSDDSACGASVWNEHMPASIDSMTRFPIGLVCCSSTLFGSVWDGAVSVLDPASGAPTHHLHTDSGATAAAFLSNGLLLAGLDSGSIKLLRPIKASRGRKIGTFSEVHQVTPHDGSVIGIIPLSTSAVGDCFAVTVGKDGVVSVFDCGTGALTKVSTVDAHGSPITACCGTNVNGLDVLTASKDGGLAAWDLRSKEPAARAAVRLSVAASSMSSAGNSCGSSEFLGAIGCSDGSVGVMDLRMDLRPSASVKMHGGLVGAVQFRPAASGAVETEGVVPSVVASGGDDGTVLLWDARALLGAREGVVGARARAKAEEMGALGASEVVAAETLAAAEAEAEALARAEAGEEDGELSDGGFGLKGEGEPDEGEREGEDVIELGRSTGGPAYSCEAGRRMSRAVEQVGMTHPDYVRALAWADAGTLWTGCWDRTVRRFAVV